MPAISTSPEPAPRAAAHPGAVLLLVLTCYLLLVLDMNVMTTALPLIRGAMRLSPVALSWVQNAYMLCFAGFLLVASRAGEVFGRRRVLKIGVGLFTAASMVIGLSQTAAELIAARAVQGIGASIIAPGVLAIISVTFAEGEERSRAMAWYSIVAGAGSSLGLVLGGVLASTVSWRWGFFLNLPVGIAAIVGIGRIIPPQPRGASRSLDLPGAALSSVGMILLVYGIVRAAEAGWGDIRVIASLASALLVLAAFVRHEARTADPMMPLHLFRQPSRNAALVARMLFIGSIIGFFFFTTQLLQDVMGFSPVAAGLGILPMSVATFVAALGVPRLTARFGLRGVIVAAHLLLGVGLLWLGLAGADASYWSHLGGPMLVLGIGNGLGLGPLTNAALAGAAPRDQAAVSGVINVAHQLGSSLGLAVLVVVFAAAAGTGQSHAAQLAGQVGAANLAAGAMNFLAAVLAAVFIRLPAARV